VEPYRFRYNRQTGSTNVFQVAPTAAEEARLADLAVQQHRALRDLLLESGVTLTVTRSRDETPDGPFCNNWFSTHPGDGTNPPTLVLYPLMAENRRPERRADLVTQLQPAYPRLLDLSPHEQRGRFLESTGSLVLDHGARVAYAALSPRTDRELAAEWARQLGFALVSFTATDGNGVPYYHTNVMMFVGHDLAGVCLEAIEAPGERRAVEERLRADGRDILPITREQAAEYCGNCIALASSTGERLFLLSSRAWRAFTVAERARLETHGRLIHTELSAFESLGGGSARCLIGELF
jgi:hypothetical protein